jgi:hypothetical protein
LEEQLDQLELELEEQLEELDLLFDLQLQLDFELDEDKRLVRDLEVMRRLKRFLLPDSPELHALTVPNTTLCSTASLAAAE